MTNIVLVDKNGTLSIANIKNIDKNILYKKCNFRKGDGFLMRTTWKVKLNNELHKIELWARDFGNANTENKYDFPPPCDSDLYFGRCCLVKVDDDNNIVDLDISLWNKIYEKLFGGFEDLVSETESEDELEEVPSNMKTKDGYLKDGFVVDSNSDKSDGKTSCSEGECVSDSDSDCESICGSETSCSDNDSEDSELHEEMYEYTSDDE